MDSEQLFHPVSPSYNVIMLQITWFYCCIFINIIIRGIYTPSAKNDLIAENAQAIEITGLLSAMPDCK